MIIMEVSKEQAREISIDFEKCHDLIPGLPSELAIECLVRVPYQFHNAMKSVCSSWRSLLSNSSFIRDRRRCNKSELLLFFVHPLLQQNAASKEVDDESKKPRRIAFGFSVYNSAFATWNRVLFPQTQIPLFCECVVIQDAGKILLIGGWDPETLQPSRDIYVLEIVGRKWRKGAPMKESRSFFACASVGFKVYVAGGHDDQKNALRSAEVYDVEKDEWSLIAPMREGRDECQGFAIGTDLGFCVLSGYATESQGRFRKDAEIYDLATNSWSKIENLWPFPDTSPRGRTIRDSSRLWCFTNRETKPASLNLETIHIPVEESSVFVGSLGGEDVVMISGRREGVMKITEKKKIGKWNYIQIPTSFSTLPFSHASIHV